MKKFLNIMSIIIIGFDLLVFILFLNGIDVVPDEAFFPLIIAGSISGFTLSWFGSKGVLRSMDILGNVFLLLFIVIVPFIIRTFIWNQP